MKKSSLFLAACLSAVAWGSRSFAADAPITIIFVDHGQAADPFHTVIKNGAQAAAAQFGVHLEFRQPDSYDMTQMANLLTAAANQRPSGIVTTVPDSDALKRPIQQIISQGIPVIATNAAPETARAVGIAVDVGQDETVAGMAAGTALKKAGGTNALCVDQEPGNVALDHRCAGFAKTFGKSKILPVDLDPANVRSKIQGALRADSSIDTIIGLGAATVGEPAVAAIKSMGMTGKIKLAAFDLSAGFLTSVKNGDALFSVDQQPYLQGYLPVMFLALKAKYGLSPSGDVASGPSLITKDQAGSVIDLSAKGIR
ncbi:sugar ABC transporter substrate-binding periplasmic protein [Ameyamaea chiangmaiensis NBRC 103196]|uniref:Substrate-binding domain-containing protein n=1 Tax=Ameyamaea chiangmaiensis TaxID=442969 RepID=A0A850P621_9PROT|nr:substrate-binding domain-containing protein [Ameyamaea chiangmaiensis]MBS4075025.1 substrate-binding domain-containing protein [Ameyamaea chiangmaiensis]NVN40067.1 substrate-binding domain-containing protein [Ameyamaea chiangmaiensis]GBQ65735.1 sugar ABC transporter substrate-binding periplasmic protein [Ameyamaea chiangmaiensis NBRC 103196]